MTINADFIRKETFSYAMRGYNVHEVDDFLDRMAYEFDLMAGEVADLKRELAASSHADEVSPAIIVPDEISISADVSRLESVVAEKELIIAGLKHQLEDRRANENILAQVLIAAQQTADSIIKKAEEQAVETIQEAREEAQRILDKANEEQQGILDSIRQLSDEREDAHDEYIELLKGYASDIAGRIADLESAKRSSVFARDKASAFTSGEKQSRKQPESASSLRAHSLRKASVEKPWLKYYPEALRHFEYTPTTVREFLCMSNRQHHAPVISYYGRKFSLRSVLANADAVAASLASLGVREGSKISMFIRAVPEFIFILLAAEKLGATLICRDNTDEENLEAIVNAESTIAFVPEYLSKETEKFYYDNSNLDHLVLVSPYTYANAGDIPDYVGSSINKLYAGEVACDSRSIAWDDFFNLGKRYAGNYEAPRDPNRSLYHSYTSGSTGPSKEVMHSAATMCGSLAQLVIPTDDMSKFQMSCLLTLLPPALVAVVNPMLLYNIASGNLLILSPFCDFEDIDLEFMRHKPNQFIAVPVMAGHLKDSKRIPEDFPMDFLYVIGGGADPVHNKWLNEMQAFLQKHRSPAVFSMCYGLSEGGAAIANPHRESTFFDCGSGIPMRGTTIGVFEADTQRELPYGEIGQICISGPSCMTGYSDPVATAKTIKVHDDGLKWVHSGDFGYMNEDGELFVLGRNVCERHGGGYLFTTVMENKICDIKGLKDCFFVIAGDKKNEGYFLPYLYIVLEDGASVEDVRQPIFEALELHEQPVRITVIPRREYFHFKTNRRILAAEIAAEEE